MPQTTSTRGFRVRVAASQSKDLLFRITNFELRQTMKTIQRTLAIIKPDAVAKNAIGDIVNTILGKGFRVIGMKMLHITKAQADGFYAVHAGKPFFQSLVNFMARGPIVVIALEK